MREHRWVPFNSSNFSQVDFGDTESEYYYLEHTWKPSPHPVGQFIPYWGRWEKLSLENCTRCLGAREVLAKGKWDCLKKAQETQTGPRLDLLDSVREHVGQQGRSPQEWCSVETQAGLILEHTGCNDECSLAWSMFVWAGSIACLAGVSSFLDWLTALTKVAHHDRDRIQPSISDYMRVPWRGWGEPGGVSLSRARTLESFVIDLWFSSAYCFLCVFGPTPSG